MTDFKSGEETREAFHYLVTGAKGFIGAWVVKNLIERGERPCIFDVDQKSHRLAALLSREQMDQMTFIQGDIRRTEDVDRAVAEHGITHIIHLAALQVPACAANPVLGGEVNVIGSLNVFEAARRRQDTVRGVVYASSAAVYGPEEFYGGPVREDAALHPGTHYGVFKQCNEANARVYSETAGVRSCGLRPWAVYGVGRDQGMTSEPTKTIKALVLGRPYTMHFTGRIDLQYADDVARIFLIAADRSLPGARVFPLHGAVVDVEDFISLLETVRPGARKLIRAEGRSLPISPDLDDSALVRDLGPIPRTPLEVGMRQTFETFQKLASESRLDSSDLEKRIGIGPMR